MWMNRLHVPREEEAPKSVVGGWDGLSVASYHQSEVINKEEKEPEAARGVELLCNYNMVLKSKYQALATSARRHREKGGK